jgi:hypothetical protein
METQIFHHSKNNIIFKKIPLKETKILQDIYHNSITNLNFQHKAKISPFKNPCIKIRPFIYYLGGQNPLSYTIYSILNLKTKKNRRFPSVTYLKEPSVAIKDQAALWGAVLNFFVFQN